MWDFVGPNGTLWGPLTLGADAVPALAVPVAPWVAGAHLAGGALVAGTANAPVDLAPLMI